MLDDTELMEKTSAAVLSAQLMCYCCEVAKKICKIKFKIKSSFHRDLSYYFTHEHCLLPSMFSEKNIRDLA